MIGGRVCKWCLAREDEKKFRHRLKNTCDSCGRMRERDRCRKCDGPKFWGRCGRCDPPPEGKEQVIILDSSSDDERTIYRAVTTTRSGSSIQLAGKKIYVDPEDTPFVLSLSRKDFLRTLC